MEKKLSYFKSLQMLHGALLAGQCVFLSIGFYLVYSRTVLPVLNDDDVSIMVSSGIIGFATATLILSFPVYRKKIIAIKSLDTVLKMNAYRAASLIRWAMIEGPVLLLILGGILTGKNGLFIAAVVMLLCFVYLRPRPAKIIEESGLSEEDIVN